MRVAAQASTARTPPRFRWYAGLSAYADTADLSRARPTSTPSSTAAGSITSCSLAPATGLVNSTFIDCRAKTTGGGVHIGPSFWSSIVGCRFVRCAAAARARWASPPAHASTASRGTSSKATRPRWPRSSTRPTPIPAPGTEAVSRPAFMDGWCNPSQSHPLGGVNHVTHYPVWGNVVLATATAALASPRRRSPAARCAEAVGLRGRDVTGRLLRVPAAPSTACTVTRRSASSSPRPRPR